MTDNFNPQEVMKAVDALSTAVKEGNEATIKKATDFLAVQDAKNQKITTDLIKSNEAIENLENTVKSLEAELKAPNISGDSKSQKEQAIKSMNNFFIKGSSGLDDLDKKFLNSYNGPNGALLINPEPIRDILSEITEVSPMLQISNIIRSKAKMIPIGVRKTIAQTAKGTEGLGVNDSNSTYGVENITAHRRSGRTIASIEELMYNSFGLDSRIRSDLIEDATDKISADFINGTGSGESEGILQDSRITFTNSGNASLITADSLFLMQTVKKGYNRVFSLNTNTLNAIRILKGTSNDHYYAQLFQAGEGGLPNRIAGFPYVIDENLPDIGAGAFPVLFGDFKKGYTVLQNDEIVFNRIEQESNGGALVSFNMHIFTGGKVVMPEAITKLKISV